ncbi:ATP-binding cassette domain-containing protein [Pseudonocardia pini]|uniref:ATP-binding cassette domain-containing protein n=1 Tax=Pseudonocardia pini TaxID=2758030 RepID=UPI0015F0F526|nr:ATP-binding cassette domain-containing protein [Pseudonocardia pini]
MTHDPVVSVEGLVKAYGSVHALDGLDLEIAAGTVCAVLGPNGAGKTTAIRVLSTLVTPDAGRARVLGHDVVEQPGEVRRSIGLAGQHAAVDDDLTGRENLQILGRMLHLGRRGARARATELLDRFDLAEAADRLVKTWSGGMRRRLDLVASFVVVRPVLLLDEPTTGLDPRSRTEIWATVRELVAGGTTVLLTTQYLEEADHLADQVVIVDRGRSVATGSPADLKATVGVRIDVEVEDVAAAARALGALAGSEPEVDPDRRRVSAATLDGALTLPAVVRHLDAAGVVVRDVALRRPTLDEVFLQLTGAAA